MLNLMLVIKNFHYVGPHFTQPKLQVVSLPVPFLSKPSSQADNMSPYLAMHNAVFSSKPLGFPAIYLKKMTSHTKIMIKKNCIKKEVLYLHRIPQLKNSEGTFSSRPPWRCSPSSKPEIPESQKTQKGDERRTEKLTSGSISWLQQISKSWTLNFGGFGGALLRAVLLYDVSSSKVT